jgi:hypothetical protein
MITGMKMTTATITTILAAVALAGMTIRMMTTTSGTVGDD